MSLKLEVICAAVRIEAVEAAVPIVHRLPVDVLEQHFRTALAGTAGG